jgi:hypothetical protein
VFAPVGEHKMRVPDGDDERARDRRCRRSNIDLV